jgi:exopolyphosphatase/guanosine-5'-triphosphate,3'-diphosphate pyrophosphatase
MDRATLSPRPEVVRDLIDRADALDHFASWSQRRLGNIDHEHRVLEIAIALFDLTRGLHALGNGPKRLLSAAALLHDVGRAVDPSEHERIGAEMILSDPSLRVSPDDRRWLAYLTLYHRGPVPELGRDEILRLGDGRAALRTVLALLRTADTLDSRSIDPPELVLLRRGRRLFVQCHVRDRAEKARKAFCRSKKYRLLEETLRCAVDVDVQVE